MFRKIVSVIMLSLLVISMSTLAFKIQIVKADDEPFYFHSTHASTPANPDDAWVMDFSPPTGTLYSYTTGNALGADVVFYFGPVASSLTIDSGNWSCYVYVSDTTISSMILDIGESTGQQGELFTSLWTAIYWTPKAGWNTITCSDSSSRVVHAGNYLAIDTRAASSGSITLLWDTDTYDSRLVPPSAQSTLTSVTCSPNSVSLGSSVTCTATVLGSDPTGTVTWSTNSSTGSFTSSISTLSSGSCSTNYTDTSAGNVTMTASYSGDPNNTPTSGACVLEVIQQYNVTFGQVGVGSDFTGAVLTVDGTNYLPASFSWDNGSTHTFTFQSPLIAEANAEQYVWTGTSGLSSLQSDSINVTTDGSIVGSYNTQYNVTFDSTGVGSDFTGTSIAIDGLNYALPTSFWYESGSTHSFAFYSPLVAVPTLRPYFWNSTTGLSALQSDSIVISGPGSVIGNYISNVHQVIVTNITVQPWVYQGYSTTILVTIKDTGDYNEYASVALIMNGESIGSYTTSLYVGQSHTFAFTWNATYIPINYPGYTLTAVAGTTSMSVSNIQVRLVGDVNGDGRVDMKDIALVARGFGSTPSSPRWNAAADVNGDGLVNMQDIALVARNFGSHYP